MPQKGGIKAVMTNKGGVGTIKLPGTGGGLAIAKGANAASKPAQKLTALKAERKSDDKATKRGRGNADK